MSAEVWKKLFHQWPADMPRRGILVASFGEQIPFDGFLVSEDMLLMDRQAPDALGARRIAVSFADIDGLKWSDVVKTKLFSRWGFAEPTAAQASLRRVPAGSGA